MSMSNLVFFECNLFVVGIEMCRNATDARAGVGENGSNTRKSSIHEPRRRLHRFRALRALLRIRQRRFRRWF